MKYIIFLLITISICACRTENLPYKNNKYTPFEIGFGNKIIETNDHNYLITGSTQQSGYSSRGRINYGESVLIKLDKDAEVIWEKKYPFSKDNPIIFDLYQKRNSDILLLTSADTTFFDNSPYRSSYLIQLDTEGQLNWKKEFSGALRKILPITEEEFIIAGLIELVVFDTVQRAPLYKPFLIQCTASGDIVWQKNYNIIVNSIEGLEKKQDNLTIRYSKYGQYISEHFLLSTTLDGDSLNIKSIQSDGQILTYNTNGESIAIEKEQNKWVLKVNHHMSNHTKSIALNKYISSEKTLLPKIRLSEQHICDICDETISNTNQVAQDKNGNLYLTVVSIEDDPEAAACLSLSTKAFCNRIVRELYVIKLNSAREMVWVKHVKGGLLPLDIKVSSKNEIMIVGANYHGERGRPQLLFLKI